MKENSPIRAKGENRIVECTLTLKDFRDRINEQAMKVLALNNELFNIGEDGAHREPPTSPDVEPTGSMNMLEDEINKLRQTLSRLEDNVSTLSSAFRGEDRL